MAKQAYREPAFDDSSAEGIEPSPDSVLVRIHGLKHVSGNIFRVMDVLPRQVDFEAIARAIGEPDDGTVNERLMMAISRAINREDLLQTLAGRLID